MNLSSTDALAARFEIIDLFSRYAQALDTKRWQELEALFTEDVAARWLQGKWAQHNRADMIAFIRGFIEPVPTHHMIANCLVEILGASATASCHVRAYHQGIGSRAHLHQETLGIYSGTAVYKAGHWRFSRFAEDSLVQVGTFEIFSP